MNKNEIKLYMPNGVKNSEKIQIIEALNSVEKHIQSYDDAPANLSSNEIANWFSFANVNVKNAVETYANKNGFKIKNLEGANNFQVVPEKLNAHNLAEVAATESESVKNETKEEDVKLSTQKRKDNPDADANIGELKMVSPTIENIVNEFEKKANEIRANNSKGDFYTNSIAQITQFDNLVKGQFPEKYPEESKKLQMQKGPKALAKNDNLAWVKDTMLYKRVYKDWLEYYRKLYRIPAYIPDVKSTTKTEKEKQAITNQFDANKNNLLQQKLDEHEKLMQELGADVKTANQQVAVAFVSAPIQSIQEIKDDLEKMAETKEENLDAKTNLDLNEKEDATEKSTVPEKEESKLIDSIKPEEKFCEKKFNDEDLSEEEIRELVEKELCKVGKNSFGALTGALKKMTENPKNTTTDIIESNIFAYYTVPKKEIIKAEEADDSEKGKVVKATKEAEIEIDKWIDKFCDKSVEIYNDLQKNDGLTKSNKLDIKNVYAQTMVCLREEQNIKSAGTFVKSAVKLAIDNAIKNNSVKIEKTTDTQSAK